nr:retrovirus-related Pol polyprotein from transposon TNT 1-94 [Tanacetum cinerariifolium]
MGVSFTILKKGKRYKSQSNSVEEHNNDGRDQFFHGDGTLSTQPQNLNQAHPIIHCSASLKSSALFNSTLEQLKEFDPSFLLNLYDDGFTFEKYTKESRVTMVTKFYIDKFDGKISFAIWKVHMQAVLTHHGYKKALRVLREVIHETIAAGLWLKLESLYMTKSLANKLRLKDRLYVFRMKPSTSVQDHLDEFNTILIDLENLDVDIDDKDKAVLLVISLPASYKHFKKIMLYGNRETLAFDDVKSALLSKQKYDDDVEPESGEGLVTKGRSSDRGESSNKNKKHRSQSRGKYSNKSCKYCKKLGHIVSDCYKLKNKLERECKGNNEKKPEKAAKVTIAKGDSDDDVYLAMDTEKSRDELIVDSSCTFHMIPYRSWFTTYESFNGGNVYMENHSICHVIGKGNIQVKMHDGVVRTITGVRHVPNLKRNLISLSTLEANGCKYSREGGVMKIFNGALVLMKAIQSGGLYVLQGTITYSTAGVATSKASLDDSKLWHYRLGHMGEKGMKNLAKKGLIKVSCNLEFCEHCVFGKQKMVSFSPGIHRTRDALDYIHSDLWGPSPVTSRGDYRVWCPDPKYRKIIHSRDVTFNEDVIINSGKDFMPHHNVDNNHTEGKVEFDFDVENSTHTQPPFNDEHIETQDDGNMPTSPQSQPQTEYLLARDPHIENSEPTNYLEAISSPECDKWVVLMEEEVKDGIPRVESNRYKARYVVRGFDQREGIDFNEVFSLVVRHTSIRVLLSIVALQDLELEQLDVKTAFLQDGSYFYLVLYVDDMLIDAPNKDQIRELKDQLSNEFDMKDLGAAKRILGIDIRRDQKMGKLTLSRTDYISKVLKKFNMSTCKPVPTPLAPHFKLSSHECPKSEEDKEDMSRVPYLSAAGSLMYAIVCTRPDLAHVISVVSKYMYNPGKMHWESVKCIICYLKGTSNIGLSFEKCPNGVVGYVDSDYAGDLDARKSLSSYIFSHCGSAICWYSSLQAITALSTTEAEYISFTEGVKEVTWLRGMVNEFGLHQEVLVVYCDNRSVVHLTKNNKLHSKTKHIEVRHHFVRDIVEKGEIIVDKIHTDDNPADMSGDENYEELWLLVQGGYRVGIHIYRDSSGRHEMQVWDYRVFIDIPVIDKVPLKMTLASLVKDMSKMSEPFSYQESLEFKSRVLKFMHPFLNLEPTPVQNFGIEIRPLIKLIDWDTNHISHPHCEALKTVPEAGQSSMSRDGSVFVYNPDVLREQFAGLVIQQGLPFNHFDNTQMTRVFQNHMQPKYNHVSRTTLKRDAMKLWIAAKKLIIDGFLNLNSSVNVTTDVRSTPHGKRPVQTSLEGLYNIYYLKYDQPNQSSSAASSSNAASSRNPMTNLLNKLKQNKRAQHDRIATSEYERFVESDFVSHLSIEELAVFLTSGRVPSIRRTRLTPASLEMCMCLKDHMDAADRVQHTSNLENSLDFEAEILKEEVQEHEAIALSDAEVTLDETASEARSSGGEDIYDMTLSESN